MAADAHPAFATREPEQTSPSCQRRVSANVKTRSVPELDSVEPVCLGKQRAGGQRVETRWG